MAKLTERQRINLALELKQRAVADDMEQMAGQLRHKYLPEWNDYNFDEKLAQERVKWLKKFDAKMKVSNREFWNLFFKRDMGK